MSTANNPTTYDYTNDPAIGGTNRPSRFLNNIRGHFGEALNNCQVTLRDTRYTAFIICALVFTIIICIAMNWSNFWKYANLTILAIAAIYLAILVSRNSCFQPTV